MMVVGATLKLRAAPLSVPASGGELPVRRTMIYAGLQSEESNVSVWHKQ